MITRCIWVADINCCWLDCGFRKCEQIFAVIQGRRQLREIVGAKLKSRGQRISPNFSGRNHRWSPKKNNNKGFSPRSEGFFWPKSQIFRSKAGDLQKKIRSSPKSEGFFWPKSQILTFFPPNNSNFFLPKNSVGGQEKNWGGKNENRGGIAPPAPPLATRLPL